MKNPAQRMVPGCSLAQKVKADGKGVEKFWFSELFFQHCSQAIAEQGHQRSTDDGTEQQKQYDHSDVWEVQVVPTRMLWGKSPYSPLFIVRSAQDWASLNSTAVRIFINSSSSVADESMSSSVSIPVRASSSNVLRMCSRICVSVRSDNRVLITSKSKGQKGPRLYETDPRVIPVSFLFLERFVHVPGLSAGS